MNIPLVIVILVLINLIFSLRHMEKQHEKGMKKSGIARSSDNDKKGSTDSNS